MNNNNENIGIEVEQEISQGAHIRCLSVVPVELEELLAEIDAESEGASENCPPELL